MGSTTRKRTASAAAAAATPPDSKRTRTTKQSGRPNKRAVYPESDDEDDEDEQADSDSQDDGDADSLDEPDEADDNEEADGDGVIGLPTPSIDPYAVLGVEKSADGKAVTSAYRKAALLYHPDRLPADEKETGKVQFQKVAFAYGILSDPTRRARYDRTGRTDDGPDGDDFNWADFYSSALRESITVEAIKAFKEEYQHSEEERQDVLAAYLDAKGDTDGILERVMVSEEADLDRFGVMIEAAIEDGQVDRLPGWNQPGKAASKKEAARRKKRREKEEGEAIKLAKELGVHDKLFGSAVTDPDDPAKGKKNKGKSKADKEADSLDALARLIQSRAKKRNQAFASLLDKYGGTNVAVDEPPEDAFEEMGNRASSSAEPKPASSKTDNRKTGRSSGRTRTGRSSRG